MKIGYRIIFMGTPDFSVPALTVLHESQHEILLVVTQPDRPKGRGRRLTPPPVKQAALKMGYRIEQPDSVKTESFAGLLKDLKPDLFVVAAFGHILPEQILAVPALGALNIHASLLPKYRGPAPIQWAIIQMETETGVTIMRMDKGMDTGDMLLSKSTAIHPNDTADSLHDRLAVLGADLMLETVNRLKDIKPVPQNHSESTYARMLTKNDAHIDWSKPAKTIDAFIRGMNSRPGAFTFHETKRLKIYHAVHVPISDPLVPGMILEAKDDRLVIATGKDALAVKEIQGESGKKLRTEDFLRGYNITPGTVLH